MLISSGLGGCELQAENPMRKRLHKPKQTLSLKLLSVQRVCGTVRGKPQREDQTEYR